MALIAANAFRPPSVLPALADTEQRRRKIACLILGRRCEGGPDLASEPNQQGGSAMMQFTDQIQRAFAETVRSGIVPDVEDLPERLRDFKSTGPELDKLWAGLLRHFHDGPRQPWATVLLEAMR